MVGNNDSNGTFHYQLSSLLANLQPSKEAFVWGRKLSEEWNRLVKRKTHCMSKARGTFHLQTLAGGALKEKITFCHFGKHLNNSFISLGFCFRSVQLLPHLDDSWSPFIPFCLLSSAAHPHPTLPALSSCSIPIITPTEASVSAAFLAVLLDPPQIQTGSAKLIPPLLRPGQNTASLVVLDRVTQWSASVSNPAGQDTLLKSHTYIVKRKFVNEISLLSIQSPTFLNNNINNNNNYSIV